MSATGVQLNWSSVTFNATPILRITDGSFGQGGQLSSFSGDADVFPTVIVNTMNAPHASFTTADVAALHGLAPGASATLVATLQDAKKAMGGAVVFTMMNSVFENADSSASHAQFGSATGTWQAFSSDGSTPPLSFARS